MNFYLSTDELLRVLYAFRETQAALQPQPAPPAENPQENLRVAPPPPHPSGRKKQQYPRKVLAEEDTNQMIPEATPTSSTTTKEADENVSVENLALSRKKAPIDWNRMDLVDTPTIATTTNIIKKAEKKASENIAASREKENLTIQKILKNGNTAPTTSKATPTFSMTTKEAGKKVSYKNVMISRDKENIILKKVLKAVDSIQTNSKATPTISTTTNFTKEVEKKDFSEYLAPPMNNKILYPVKVQASAMNMNRMVFEATPSNLIKKAEKKASENSAAAREKENIIIQKILKDGNTAPTTSKATPTFSTTSNSAKEADKNVSVGNLALSKKKQNSCLRKVMAPMSSNQTIPEATPTSSTTRKKAKNKVSYKNLMISRDKENLILKKVLKDVNTAPTTSKATPTSSTTTKPTKEGDKKFSNNSLASSRKEESLHPVKGSAPMIMVRSSVKGPNGNVMPKKIQEDMRLNQTTSDATPISSTTTNFTKDAEKIVFNGNVAPSEKIQTAISSNRTTPKATTTLVPPINHEIYYQEQLKVALYWLQANSEVTFSLIPSLTGQKISDEELALWRKRESLQPGKILEPTISNHPIPEAITSIITKLANEISVIYNSQPEKDQAASSSNLTTSEATPTFPTTTKDIKEAEKKGFNGILELLTINFQKQTKDITHWIETNSEALTAVFSKMTEEQKEVVASLIARRLKQDLDSSQSEKVQTAMSLNQTTFKASPPFSTSDEKLALLSKATPTFSTAENFTKYDEKKSYVGNVVTSSRGNENLHPKMIQTPVNSDPTISEAQLLLSLRSNTSNGVNEKGIPHSENVQTPMNQTIFEATPTFPVTTKLTKEAEKKIHVQSLLLSRKKEDARHEKIQTVTKSKMKTSESTSSMIARWEMEKKVSDKTQPRKVPTATSSNQAIPGASPKLFTTTKSTEEAAKKAFLKIMMASKKQESPCLEKVQTAMISNPTTSKATTTSSTTISITKKIDKKVSFKDVTPSEVLSGQKEILPGSEDKVDSEIATSSENEESDDETFLHYLVEFSKSIEEEIERKLNEMMKGMGFEKDNFCLLAEEPFLQLEKILPRIQKNLETPPPKGLDVDTWLLSQCLFYDLKSREVDVGVFGLHVLTCGGKRIKFGEPLWNLKTILDRRGSWYFLSKKSRKIYEQIYNWLFVVKEEDRNRVSELLRNVTVKPQLSRKSFTIEQREDLLRSFKADPNPTMRKSIEIATRMNVDVWRLRKFFKGRRAFENVLEI